MQYIWRSYPVNRETVENGMICKKSYLGHFKGQQIRTESTLGIRYQEPLGYVILLEERRLELLGFGEWRKISLKIPL